MNTQLKFQILRTQEFNEWFSEQTLPTQGLVLARLHRISVDGYFGTSLNGLLECEFTQHELAKWLL